MNKENNIREVKKGMRISVLWYDSYGVTTGWSDIEEYKSEPLEIESLGYIIDNSEYTIAVAHNYAKATDLTPEQANGIMVIPKSAITRITFFPFSSSYQELVLEQKQQHF